MNENVNSGVRAQYADDKNLSARIKLHRLYSTNSQGWATWVFGQLAFPKAARVLELGCGNGQLWVDNRDFLPQDCQFIISDFSPGMLASAKERLRSVRGDFDFRVIDAQKIPLPDASIEVCIASHMLYHVPDIPLALAEIHRVLVPSGKLYATTVGEGHLAQIRDYLSAVDQRIDFSTNAATRFSLQNAGAILGGHFVSVERSDYEDSLKITRVDDLIEYILSASGLSNVGSFLKGEKLVELRARFEDELSEKGYIHVSKESGMYIAA